MYSEVEKAKMKRNVDERCIFMPLEVLPGLDWNESREPASIVRENTLSSVKRGPFISLERY